SVCPHACHEETPMFGLLRRLWVRRSGRHAPVRHRRHVRCLGIEMLEHRETPAGTISFDYVAPPGTRGLDVVGDTDRDGVGDTVTGVGWGGNAAFGPSNGPMTDQAVIQSGTSVPVDGTETDGIFGNVSNLIANEHEKSWSDPSRLAGGVTISAPVVIMSN